MPHVRFNPLFQNRDPHEFKSLGILGSDTTYSISNLLLFFQHDKWADLLKKITFFNQTQKLQTQVFLRRHWQEFHSLQQWTLKFMFPFQMNHQQNGEEIASLTSVKMQLWIHFVMSLQILHFHVIFIFTRRFFRESTEIFPFQSMQSMKKNYFLRIVQKLFDHKTYFCDMVDNG